MAHPLLRKATQLPGFRYANMIPRAAFACSYFTPVIGKIGRWIMNSNEDTNFTYDLQEENLLALACTLSCITGVPKDEAFRYLKEVQEDPMLRDHVVRRTMSSVHRSRSDATCRFGHRLGWYAVARILKPRIVVEAGIDKGLGSVTMAAALLRNRAEGFDGKYYGTDINSDAGWLLGAPYDTVTNVFYGDSNSNLDKVEGPIDLFINGIAFSSVYEAEGYRAIQNKLAKGAVCLSESSHWSDALMKFSIANEREYIFFREKLKDHWYPGGGIGFSFRAAELRERLLDLGVRRDPIHANGRNGVLPSGNVDLVHSRQTN